jgi:hypothetical protein
VSTNEGSVHQSPNIQKLENSQWQYDESRSNLIWRVTDPSDAILKFTIPGGSAEALFPLSVQFSESYSLLDIQLEGAILMNTGEPLTTTIEKKMSTATYKIENE